MSSQSDIEEKRGVDDIGNSTLPIAAPAPVAAPPAVGPPPNGGLKAWSQVLGAFFLMVNTWGLINAYGVFQTYYATTLLPDTSPSDIAWIGSIQGFLMLILAVIFGWALDAGYFFLLSVCGVVFQVLGLMMTSLGKEYWQLVLAQGICVGIGSGCFLVSAFTIVGTYFSTRRSYAMGWTATGSSVGGIIYPIVVRRLIVQVGFPWAVRAMGFIVLGTLAISISLLRPRLPPKKLGPLLDLQALKDLPYFFFLLSMLFTYMGLYIPFFYITDYALSIGIDENISFYTLIIMSAGSIPGRVAPPYFADKIGNVNVMLPATLICAILMLCWISVKSLASLIVVSILFGFFSGSAQALIPSVVVWLAPDLSKAGVRIGMTLFMCGLGLLVGSPIGGAIIDAQSPERSVYWGVYLWGGITVLLGAAALLVTRTLKVGLKVVIKA
ncbi:Riboflavin transporter MCH5 [Talaromyces pinophilus]|nr:Riboflavin transporter MCH5 [Talaromyces pinophilus]